MTVGSYESEVAASLCGILLPHGDPQWAQLCSHECPQKFTSHCMELLKT